MFFARVSAAAIISFFCVAKLTAFVIESKEPAPLHHRASDHASQQVAGAEQPSLIIGTR